MSDNFPVAPFQMSPRISHVISSRLLEENVEVSLFHMCPRFSDMDLSHVLEQRFDKVAVQVAPRFSDAILGTHLSFNQCLYAHCVGSKPSGPHCVRYDTSKNNDVLSATMPPTTVHSPAMTTKKEPTSTSRRRRAESLRKMNKELSSSTSG